VQVAGEGGDARLVPWPADSQALSFPGGREVGVVEAVGRSASSAEPAAGGEGPVSGLVVNFASGAELVEALADGGFGEAELAGDFSQGEGAAASAPLPMGQQLDRIDGRHRVAPGLAAQAGEPGGFGAELAVQADRSLEPVSPADRSSRIGGVEAVIDRDQGDVLGGEEESDVGEVAQRAREVAQGADDDALDGIRPQDLEKLPETLSRALWS
jgi:hypothetical protein